MALIKRHYTDEETLITAKNLNDIQDAVLELEAGLFAMDNVQTGEAVKITDAASRGFVSMKIYGKTTQGGLPTPEAPVDLVSAAEDSISIHVCGKNLFTGWIVGGINADTGADDSYAYRRRTEYLPVIAGAKQISVSSIPAELYNMFAFYDANKVFISRSVATRVSSRIVDVPEGARYFRFTVYATSTDTSSILEADALSNITMIEPGNAATDYERAKPIQTATINFDGLRGLPVSSGGNYIDSNGQSWICDEIDLRRGVHIQRIGQVTLNGTESWLGYLVTEVNQFHVPIPSIHKANERGAYCKYYRPIILSERNLNYGTVYTYNGGIAINTLECANVTEWREFLATRPITVLYVLDMPVETPLAAEHLAAYDALYTYRDNTTVCNSGHAYMELEYVMDAKKYIDKLSVSSGGVAARLANITLRASAWTGTDNLHSQVVTVAGITEYSKVDLLPSVEQLAIFHNKDVAFVTENEDGVVTVYAIGDKPTQDYTMQVSIAEVVA